MMTDPRRLEDRFLWLWTHVVKGPALEREVRVGPGRKFRFDFVHRASRVAVEIEGGTWNQGKHGRGSGIRRDCEKACYAAFNGWRVFRLTTDMLRSDPQSWLGMIATAIEKPA